CQNTDQVTVTVNPLPNIDAGTDVTICDGASTTISATGGTSYTWDNSLGAGATHSVSPTSTTIYTVTGTDANGCQNTDQVTVTVNPLPTVTISSDFDVCIGEDINLTAGGGTSYSWTGPNGFTSTSQNPTITGATA